MFETTQQPLTLIALQQHQRRHIQLTQTLVIQLLDTQVQPRQTLISADQALHIRQCIAAVIPRRLIRLIAGRLQLRTAAGLGNRGSWLAGTAAQHQECGGGQTQQGGSVDHAILCIGVI
ncbi:MAG: hypothetical protein B7X57_02895 [Erythrobacter sp. 34-65-8]|nr:MAG: hypothetical protein B7X57_02895 [Erythrobacter sp. 34-65-8]